MTGPELRQIREDKGYSLTALARVLDVSVTTICRYQSGALTIPRAVALAVKSLRRRDK
jgi:predicted transcriptional regulator